MLRKHARSASGLCTDRLTHGAHSGTHVCPQSASDDRPKLRNVAPRGAVELFAGPQQYVRCATPPPGLTEHNRRECVESHCVASHRIATAHSLVCGSRACAARTDVAVRSLRKSSCSGHHRVTKRQRCDHVEERRSHLLARGVVMRPSATLTGCGRIETGAHPCRGTGRARARTHARGIPCRGQAHGDAESAKLSTQRRQPLRLAAPLPSRAGFGVLFHVACCMLQEA
jgi:hypothetical protein